MAASAADTSARGALGFVEGSDSVDQWLNDLPSVAFPIRGVPRSQWRASAMQSNASEYHSRTVADEGLRCTLRLRSGALGI